MPLGRSRRRRTGPPPAVSVQVSTHADLLRVIRDATPAGRSGKFNGNANLLLFRNRHAALISVRSEVQLLPGPSESTNSPA